MCARLGVCVRVSVSVCGGITVGVVVIVKYMSTCVCGCCTSVILKMGVYCNMLCIFFTFTSHCLTAIKVPLVSLWCSYVEEHKLTKPKTTPKSTP
jgi:hypothetical protein